MSGTTQAFLILFAIYAAFASVVIIFGPPDKPPEPPTVVYVERDPRTGIVTMSTMPSFSFSAPATHLDPPTTSVDPEHK